MGLQNQSVLNFLEFWTAHLDQSKLKHLYLIHCGGGFEHLAIRISQAIRPSLPCTLLNFITDAERVRDVGISYRTDPSVAICLTYLLDYGRVASDDHYRALIKNLGAFDYWDVTRVRLLADVPDNLFDAFFDLPKSYLQQFALGLMEKVCDASLIVIKDGDETNLEVSVNPGTWYANDGSSSDHILPCGEISAIPLSVDGILTFEGTILGTIPIGFKYGKIHKGDLVLCFGRGQIQSVRGNNHALVHDIQRILERLPAIRTVGETSISFNTGIKELTGVGYQWEEKYPGFHFGLGAELSENLSDLSQRHCDHHIDFVLQSCDILTTNGLLFHKGTFLV